MMSKTFAAAFAFALGLTACAADPSPAEDSPDAATAEPDAPETPTTPAAPLSGDLDPTFGTNGVRTLGITGYATRLVAQGDKLVACVNVLGADKTHAEVLRFTSNGAPDETFGPDAGKLVVSSMSASMRCDDLVVHDDGSLTMFEREGDAGNFTWRALPIDADGNAGAPMSLSDSIFATFSARISASGMNFVHGVAGLLGQSIYIKPTGSIATASFAGGSMFRPFVVDGKPTAVGTYPVGNGEGWGILREGATAGQLEAPPAVVKTGDDTKDLMHDAIVMADGSILAVGGADLDKQIMVARFATDGVSGIDVKNVPIGLTSTAYAATLDSQERAIVVGSASIGGKTQWIWQRFAGAGVNLDTSYQKEGIGHAPAPSGSGELVAAVSLDGAIYALADYDTETSTPKVALVKIVE